MKYSIIFAVFVGFISFAGPAIINRIIYKTPYESEIHKEILNDLNDLRAMAKVGELSHDVRLDCAAQAHVDDIASRRICSVVGRNGETPRDRIEQCGLGEFKQAVELIICNSDWDMAKMLKDLPEHRIILKMPEWKYVGIGVRENSYVIYLTY